MVPFGAMNRSLSTPDLINALTALSKRSLPGGCQTNLDAVFFASQRHSSVESSGENANSISVEHCHNSRNELTVPNGDPGHHMPHLSNGSLISFDGNVQLLEGTDRLIMEQCDRRVSINSVQSESRRNLLSLQNVGQKLQRTHANLKRTRLLHVFYLLALPVYTLIGAVIFQALDGEHDDQMLAKYESRCMDDRPERLRELEALCLNAGAECFHKFSALLAATDRCYRSWRETHDVPSHPMSDFTNALVYSFSVYTSIGYGTVSASTTASRICTVVYAALGIPLFFAAIKEEGNMARISFVRFLQRNQTMAAEESASLLLAQTAERKASWKCGRHGVADRPSGCRRNGTSTGLLPQSLNCCCSWFVIPSGVARINGEAFVASVIFFICYLLAASYIYSIMAGWDYFTSFYFTFNSVALIGFGDVYPSDSKIIVANMPFILIGIRVKAFEASRKARMSISKYSHSLMLHTRTPWSRRNSPAFDQNEANFSNNSSKKNFERHRKRRQSAPAITVQLERR
ncbi:hypothetical protein M3Y99_00404400 [Aphelenchoides fujianensis]|nr:hypothetical protein M3Y99_00404400 [Aphelenchoides fujianensis]